MPLIKSASKKALSSNIEAEKTAGKPQKQSLAIALSVQRAAKGKKKPAGYKDGGTVSQPSPQPSDEDKIGQGLTHDSDNPGVKSLKKAFMAHGGVAKAILERKKKMSDGGQVDIAENAEEDGELSASSADLRDFNEDAVLKEYYDESEELSKLDYDTDSKGHSAEDEHDLNLISKLRARVRSRRGY